MKHSKFIAIIWSLTFIFIAVGATFAYFAVNEKSKDGAVAAWSSKININLKILPLYYGKALIPTDDDDILMAYEDYYCVDSFGNGACQAYDIIVENFGIDLEYEGSIKFTLNDIQNFKYMILDEDGNIYVDKTEVVNDMEQTLGDSFSLGNGEFRNFKLIVWLPNMNYSQENDSFGHFNAAIKYFSSNGSTISGHLSDM